MKITNVASHLAKFTGGQVEVQDGRNHHTCGQTSSLQMGHSDEIIAQLVWVAKKSRAGVWANTTSFRPRQTINVDMHDMELEADGRLRITPNADYRRHGGTEVVILHPSNKPFLDRTKVRGL